MEARNIHKHGEYKGFSTDSVLQPVPNGFVVVAQTIVGPTRRFPMQLVKVECRGVVFETENDALAASTLSVHQAIDSVCP
ncbi:hypothetical protein KTD28_00940 [Burkholderia gladioli]|uniref:hypothetical protein n=1 Tax=Burkholderia gladioli TaxID=28095 RepID=UPI00164166DC|nr:hypothetical protein [Burkholderia gladioli]MBU9153169.1 hypothetical protein [Burkholderia gladioli]